MHTLRVIKITEMPEIFQVGEMKDRGIAPLALTMLLLFFLSALAQDRKTVLADDTSSADQDETMPGDIDAGDEDDAGRGVQHTVLWVDQFIYPQETKFYMLPR